MPAPSSMDIALRIVGEGVGPARLSAARALGLTTQLPAIESIAVPGRPPAPLPGVRFVSRPYVRQLHGLHSDEVAVLETLRDWPIYSEAPWQSLVEAVQKKQALGTVRLDRLDAVVARERSPRLRDRWRRLRAAFK